MQDFQAYADVELRSLLLCVVARSRLVVGYRRFGTSYLSYLQGQALQDQLPTCAAQLPTRAMASTAEFL
jgi:hypothetical protein